MIFKPTNIDGVILITPEPITDHRGHFARMFCAQDFAAQNLPNAFVQSSISQNPKKHTLRGLHYQSPPAAEAKLIRCTRGAIFDVILDLRKTSPTYLTWQSFELTAENAKTLFIPECCAHGFLTLEDHTDVFYQMTTPHSPANAAGIRWNDPTFAITWPQGEKIMSDRDATYPDYKSQ
jgi:dTDP-4-dehydrorhamnose 3,5-epimerase